MAPEKPLCVICGQHPVSQKYASACHSPKCKRLLADERKAMAQAQKVSKAKLARSRRNLTRPDKLKRELAADVRRFVQYGLTETEAVWKVAGDQRVKPAEVLLAYREVGDAAA